MQSQSISVFKSFKPLGENFADVCVVVQDKTYKCHKIILSHVSKFFERLLVTDCEETSSGVINLEDVESRIFDIIYDFIYSGGDTPVLSNASFPTLLELLVCADKWFMPCLTGACTSVLIGRQNWSDEDLSKAFDKAVAFKNSILTDHVKKILGTNNEVNSRIFKEFLECFKSLNMTESVRFHILENLIKSQHFYSPGMQFSLPDISLPTPNPTEVKKGESPKVSELLAMINYKDMSILDFKAGPGRSTLITPQSKYDYLCAKPISCRYCGRQQ